MIGAMKRRWKSKKAKVLLKGGELVINESSPTSRGVTVVDGCEDIEKIIKPPSPRQVHPILEKDVKYADLQQYLSPHQLFQRPVVHKKSSTLSSSEEGCPFIRVNSGRIELVNSKDFSDIPRKSGCGDTSDAFYHRFAKGFNNFRDTRRIGGRNDSRHSWCGPSATELEMAQKSRGGVGMSGQHDGFEHRPLPPTPVTTLSSDEPPVSTSSQLSSTYPSPSHPSVSTTSHQSGDGGDSPSTSSSSPVTNHNQSRALVLSPLKERLAAIEEIAANIQNWQTVEKNEYERCVTDLTSQVSRAVALQQLMKSEVEKLQQRVIELEKHNKAMASMIIPTLMKLHVSVGKESVIAHCKESPPRESSFVDQATSVSPVREVEGSSSISATPSQVLGEARDAKTVNPRKIDCRIPRMSNRVASRSTPSSIQNYHKRCEAFSKQLNDDDDNGTHHSETTKSHSPETHGEMSMKSESFGSTSKTSVKSSSFSGIPRMSSLKPHHTPPNKGKESPKTRKNESSTESPSTHNNSSLQGPMTSSGGSNGYSSSGGGSVINGSGGGSRLPVRKGMKTGSSIPTSGSYSSATYSKEKHGKEKAEHLSLLKGEKTTGNTKGCGNPRFKESSSPTVAVTNISSPMKSNNSSMSSPPKSAGTTNNNNNSNGGSSGGGGTSKSKATGMKDEGYSTMSSEALAEQEKSEGELAKERAKNNSNNLRKNAVTMHKSNTFNTFQEMGTGGDNYLARDNTNRGRGKVLAVDTRNFTSLPFPSKNMMTTPLRTSQTASPSFSPNAQKGFTSTPNKDSTTGGGGTRVPRIFWGGGGGGARDGLDDETEEPSTSTILWEDSDDSDILFLPLEMSSGSSSYSTLKNSSLGGDPERMRFDLPPPTLRMIGNEPNGLNSGSSGARYSPVTETIQGEERPLTDKWTRMDDVRNQSQWDDEWAWDWDGLQQPAQPNSLRSVPETEVVESEDLWFLTQSPSPQPKAGGGGIENHPLTKLKQSEGLFAPTKNLTKKSELDDKRPKSNLPTQIDSSTWTKTKHGKVKVKAGGKNDEGISPREKMNGGNPSKESQKQGKSTNIPSSTTDSGRTSNKSRRSNNELKIFESPIVNEDSLLLSLVGDDNNSNNTLDSLNGEEGTQPVIEFTPEYYHLVNYGSNLSFSDNEMTFFNSPKGHSRHNQSMNKTKDTTKNYSSEGPKKSSSFRLDDKISQTDFESSHENIFSSSELFTECQNCLELIKKLVAEDSAASSTNTTLDRNQAQQTDPGFPTAWLTVPKRLPANEVDRILEIVSSSESEDVSPSN